GAEGSETSSRKRARWELAAPGRSALGLGTVFGTGRVRRTGFHFARKRFMVPRDFAIGKLRSLIDIKGLAGTRIFGGRLDAIHFDAGGGPHAGLLRRDADRARSRRRPLRTGSLAAAFA